MSKRQKKKAPVVEEDPYVEVVTKTEYICEDTKCITGVEPEYQWGEIYRLITRREVPDMGLEEEGIYANIEKYSLMKIATNSTKSTWTKTDLVDQPTNSMSRLSRSDD